LDQTRDLISDKKGPLIVHCSSGIGGTGKFCNLDLPSKVYFVLFTPFCKSIIKQKRIISPSMFLKQLKK